MLLMDRSPATCSASIALLNVYYVPPPRPCGASITLLNIYYVPPPHPCGASMALQNIYYVLQPYQDRLVYHHCLQQWTDEENEADRAQALVRENERVNERVGTVWEWVGDTSQSEVGSREI